MSFRIGYRITKTRWGLTRIDCCAQIRLDYEIFGIFEDLILDVARMAIFENSIIMILLQMRQIRLIGQ